MRSLLPHFMGCWCGSALGADGKRKALAGDGVSAGLEASFKAGWVITPAQDASSDAIEAVKAVVNTVFSLCASAREPSPPARGLDIRFNGNCGVPFTDLRFEGGLAIETVDTTLQIGFDRLH